MSQLHITLELNQEEMANLDRLRGNLSREDYLQTRLLKKIRRLPVPQDELDPEGELTVEDHIRLAAEAETNYMELEDVVEHVRQRRAARHARHAPALADVAG